MEKRNFSAGPSMLAPEVEEQLREACTAWGPMGLPLWSTSHLTPEFKELARETIALLREALGVGPEYEVLLLPPQTQMQFTGSLVNLMTGPDALPRVLCVESGHWSKAARLRIEALYGRFGKEQHRFISSEISGYCAYPLLSPDEPAEYAYVCTNETTNGTRFRYETLPDRHPLLIGDMCSDILSRPIPHEKFAVYFAGAQKNIGIAGCVIVVVRRDLLVYEHPLLPATHSYAEQARFLAKQGTIMGTPCNDAILAVNLTLKWLKKQGGAVVMEKRNRDKAALLYEALDESEFYRGTAEMCDRSDMNVIFTLARQELTVEFLKQAQAEGFFGIKGHVGSEPYYGPHVRISLYNAQPRENVEDLVAFMRDFRARMG